MSKPRPKRIQLRRTAGWRKPEGAINVARPTKWGNPFRAETTLTVSEFKPVGDGGVLVDHLVGCDERLAVELYRQHILGTFGLEQIRAELGGHDLACWCAADAPCHADVLLELANPRRKR